MAQDIKITPGSGTPQILFVGSGTSTSGIEMNVQEDSDLSFGGYQGELFNIGPELQSGTIFAVKDISGLDQISVDASGGIKLNQFYGETQASGLLTVATGIALQRNTPAVTTDKLYNVAGDLYFDGSAVGGGGGSSYTAGSGLTLVGTEFNTSGTGHFDQVTFTDDQIKIGADVGTNIGTYVITIGDSAGAAIADGACTYPIYIGQRAGKEQAGDHNIAIGYRAAEDPGAATQYNIVIGYQAGKEAGGDRNVALGYWGRLEADGDYNICLGYKAGKEAIGDKNIFFGYQAGAACAGSNNIEFVTNAEQPSVLDDLSNKIHIENTIIGDTSEKKIAIGNVGVGDVVPDATLEVKPNSDDVGLIVQGASSQTANLAEFQNSSETSLVSIEADGSVIISSLPTSDPTNAGQLWRDGTDLKVSLG